MLEDITILVALLVVLLALVWLIARMVIGLRQQRQWVKSWRDLAQQHGMKLNSSHTRCSVTGMYRGRILHILGTLRAGTALHLTTSNYTSNSLVIKTNSSQASRNPAGNQNSFSRSFSLVSGSKEFLDQLVRSRDLGQRLAPLASIPNLTISLSGEELSLTTPRLYIQSDELLRFMDALSDLAGGIEELHFTSNGTQ